MVLALYIFISWLATEMVWVFDGFSASPFFDFVPQILDFLLQQGYFVMLEASIGFNFIELEGYHLFDVFLPTIVLRMILMMPLVC